MTATPVRTAPPLPAPAPSRRAALLAPRPLLTAALVLALVSLAVSLVGLVVDPRTIAGAPAWLKPLKFGVSITLYLVALRWMVGVVRGHRRLLAAVSAVVLLGLVAELALIDLQVLRGTASHFNMSSAFDIAVYSAMGGIISTVFVATAVAAVLVIRTRGVDPPVAAGVGWGLLVTLVGMAEAVLMTVNLGWSAGGGHTVGGVDGGPGLPITGWSTVHGDLRVGHFLGLHALQVLPILAFVLLRVPALAERTRTRLLGVAGAGYLGALVLVTWQALRGQPLLAPDAVTLAAAAVLAAGVLGAGAAVLREQRRGRDGGATPPGAR